jgi:hypothetical protein
MLGEAVMLHVLCPCHWRYFFGFGFPVSFVSYFCPCPSFATDDYNTRDGFKMVQELRKL